MCVFAWPLLTLKSQFPCHQAADTGAAATAEHTNALRANIHTPPIFVSGATTAFAHHHLRSKVHDTAAALYAPATSCCGLLCEAHEMADGVKHEFSVLMPGALIAGMTRITRCGDDDRAIPGRVPAAKY